MDTLIKANCSWIELNLIKNYFDFYKISQNFLVFSKNIFKFNLIYVKIFPTFFKNFFQNYSKRLYILLKFLKFFSKVCQISQNLLKIYWKLIENVLIIFANFTQNSLNLFIFLNFKTLLTESV